MSRRAYAFGLALGPALFFAGPMIAVSCTGSNPPADAATGTACTDGTIQLGECEGVDGAPPEERFTDEACQSLDTATMRRAATADDSRAPVIDAPTESQALPAATPFAFAWHPSPAFSLRPAGARSGELAPRGLAFADRVRQAFALLPSAEAHCPAFGGVGYALVFTASNNQVLLRAETGNRTYTPTPEAWTRLVAARGTIGLTIVAARFSNNDVTEGPVVQTTARRFTLAP